MNNKKGSFANKLKDSLEAKGYEFYGYNIVRNQTYEDLLNDDGRDFQKMKMNDISLYKHDSPTSNNGLLAFEIPEGKNDYKIMIMLPPKNPIHFEDIEQEQSRIAT